MELVWCLAILVPGSFLLYFFLPLHTIEMIGDRQFGFLKETLVAPVSRTSIMIGRTLGGATVATLQGIIVFTISLIAGFRPESWLLVPAAIVLMFIVGFLFTALGTAIASILSDFQGFRLIMNFLVMPVFFLSGALFPLEGLPVWLTVLTRIDPMTYGVDALRGLLGSGSHFGLLLNMSILLGAIVVTVMVGAQLFRRIQV